MYFFRAKSKTGKAAPALNWPACDGRWVACLELIQV